MAASVPSSADGPSDPLRAWFAAKGWVPFPFQVETWEAYLVGESGLIHAPTGLGKTCAAFGGPVLEWMAEHSGDAATSAGWGAMKPQPLRVLWLTPLRALAHDTAQSLAALTRELGLPWEVELRTGDTASSVKARQKTRLPAVLVTTPESLSVLLSYVETCDLTADLRCVVVDEWHELMATKRGVQTELALARLRAWRPGLRTWGVSATMGNLEQAARVLMGEAASTPATTAARSRDRKGAGEYPEANETSPAPSRSRLLFHSDDDDDTAIAAAPRAASPRLITAPDRKRIEIATLIPTDIERFPWAGHLGINLLPQVLEAIESARSTLLFTNTRSQAEIWFRAIVASRPELIGEVALHHGSLERDLRERVEAMLREGRLRCVVCTSSMELGVDFSPVDQVLQVGSPKGVARLLQRAGRSGHRPGAVSRVLGVPTHAFELVEFAAARQATLQRRIEARKPVELALDVLAQHLVTVAAGGGFDAGELLAELRATHAFRNLTDEQWGWCLDFVTRGGPALRAYPHFARVVRRDEDGRYVVASRLIERHHRLTIGTITSNAMIRVQVMGGSTLGSVEESFIGRLEPGDRFFFAGHALELVRVRDMTAFVRRSSRGSGAIPSWDGGRFPLTTQLADAVRRKLRDAGQGRFDDPEIVAVAPILELQSRWSALPKPGELLIESTETREGFHTFVFPFEGRLVHEGLGALLAHRLAQAQPRTVTITANDYGFELLAPEPIDELHCDEGWRRLLSRERLIEDLLACLNSTQMARRQFRDIARIAGLVFPGFPGMGKTARQLQASSELFYEVFRDFDPENLLLDQARREVFEEQLEVRRLVDTLERVESLAIVRKSTPRFTPLAFPLWADRLRSQQVSSEKWSQRVERMVVQLERAAAAEPPAKARSRGRRQRLAS